MPRLHRLVLGVVLAAVVSLPAASAHALVPLSCPGDVSRPFLPWLDPMYYTLASGGDIDAGAPGWTLRNARAITSTSAPALSETGEQYVLRLGSGASATSPATCVSVLSPTLRFMVRPTGSALGVLVVTAVTDNGAVLPLGVATGLVGGWRPSLPMALTTTLVPNLGNDTASVRFRFTAVGLGAGFKIDDVFVDPYRKG